MTKNEIVLFKSSDGEVSLPVPVGADSVWLTQAQMAQLFGKNRTVIGRHIRNAIEEGEIDPKVVCANFAHTTQHGAIAGKMQTQEVVGYNLDVVISVGYRNTSQQHQGLAQHPTTSQPASSTPPSDQAAEGASW